MNAGVWITACCIMSSLSPIMTSSGEMPEGCVVDGKSYSVGESFGSTISAEGGDYPAVCYNCTCYNIIPLCQETHCPELHCENPVRVDGQCCWVCTGTEPPVDRQCVYNGLYIEHGATFHPAQIADNQDNDQDELSDNQDSKILSNTTDYCYECACSGGAVTCRDVSNDCPSLDCGEDVAVILDGTCCPACPVPPTVEPPSPQDCLSEDGRYFANGQSWHPLIIPFGPIPCINCTCIDSREICHTLPCPIGPLPPCSPDEPVPDVILCCPTCRRVAAPSKTTPTATTSIPTLISPWLVPITAAPVLPCNPSHTVKVWKHRSADAAAVEFMEDVGVDVRIYSWSQSGDSYVKEETEMSHADFSDISYKYDFQGWTLNRRVNGLTTRESKREKIENCTDNCSYLIVKFLRPAKCELAS